MLDSNCFLDNKISLGVFSQGTSMATDPGVVQARALSLIARYEGLARHRAASSTPLAFLDLEEHAHGAAGSAPRRGTRLSEQELREKKKQAQKMKAQTDAASREAGERETDATMISNLRTALEEAAARKDRDDRLYSAHLKKLRAEHDKLRAKHDELLIERNELRADNEELLEAVADFKELLTAAVEPAS